MHWIALQSRPEPRPAPHAEAPLADARSALAWWVLQFTPMVALVEDALVLEVSASERLFGGLAALQAAKRHDLALGGSPRAIDAEAHRDHRAARGIEGGPRVGGVRALAVLRASDLLAHTFPDVGPD